MLSLVSRFPVNMIAAADGISEAEGWSPAGKVDTVGGSRSYRNHNPGNIRSSEFQTGTDADGFAIFPTDEVGLYAMFRLLTLYVEGAITGFQKGGSLFELLQIWTAEKDQAVLEQYVSKFEYVSGLKRYYPATILLE